jgi:hypothetical protein
MPRRFSILADHNSREPHLPWRIIAPWMIVLAGAFTALAYGHAQTETFLLRMPEGFKLGWQKGNWAEWIPISETVEEWSEMITIQTYHVSPSVSQEQFLQGIAVGWMKACPETPAQKMFSGQTNGYSVSMLLLSCPRNAKTGRPETTAFRVILGNDALYSIQRAFRSVPQGDQLAVAMKFLGTVSVCDSERPGHPCPSAAPNGSAPP